jgi:hypothetical protein
MLVYAEYVKAVTKIIFGSGWNICDAVLQLQVINYGV